MHALRCQINQAFETVKDVLVHLRSRTDKHMCDWILIQAWIPIKVQHIFRFENRSLFWINNQPSRLDTHLDDFINRWVNLWYRREVNKFRLLLAMTSNLLSISLAMATDLSDIAVNGQTRIILDHDPQQQCQQLQDNKTTFIFWIHQWNSNTNRSKIGIVCTLMIIYAD